jgi:hypothetical protein
VLLDEKRRHSAPIDMPLTARGFSRKERTTSSPEISQGAIRLLVVSVRRIWDRNDGTMTGERPAAKACQKETSRAAESGLVCPLIKGLCWMASCLWRPWTFLGPNRA